MLNGLAKSLLMATSLSPVLGAVAVNQAARHEPWTRWSGWLIAAVLLVCLCWLLLRYSAKSAQQHEIHIKEFERNDKEVLAFLLTYLLPFVSSDKLTFVGDWFTGAYVFGVILLVFTHAGAFHFNPLLGLMGYHFYSFKNDDGVSQLLISRTELRRPEKRLSTVRLAHGVYLNARSTLSA